MKSKEQSYESGRLFVRPGLSYRDAIVGFVESRQFLKTGSFESIKVANRRNQLFRVRLDGLPRPLIMKINWINPEFPLTRRVALFLNNRFKNYPRRGYYGALALEQAAISGMRAIAYWNHLPWSMQESGYFLYEEIDADCSIIEYQIFASRETSSTQQQVFNKLIERTADMVRQLHLSNLRHGSIELGNFLVEFGCGMDAADADAASAARLYLIDTDRMTRVKIKVSLIKTIFDIRDLCRMGFDATGRKYFLRCYLNEKYSDHWQQVLEFWHLRHIGDEKEYWKRRSDLAQPQP